MNIHRIGSDGAERVHALLAAAGEELLARGYDHWSPPAPIASIREQCVAKEVYLAEIEGGDAATWTIGGSGWRADGAWSPAARPCYLSRFAIHPRAQRRGLGRALAGLIAAAWRQRGYDAIRLDVVAGCAPAMRFWTACGWRPRGSWRWTNWHGKAYDLVDLELMP